ncbi:hypothetical protein HY486_01195 [Candidatus Woesearchaeota archaeon]|nr:hypothetical protein [Candidatus Woesearchaeota archaeon]
MKAIELQAHYIFVIVAGVFILGFFIAIAGKLRSGSEDRAAFQISTAIKSALTSTAQSPGSTLNLSFPKLMQYDCTNACDCSIQIGNKKTTIKESMFSPKEYPTTKATLFTKLFGTPPATNNIYITNPEYKYYLIYPEGNLVAEQIIKTIPEAIRMQAIPLSQISHLKFSGEIHSVIISLLLANPIIPPPEFETLTTIHITSNSATYKTKTKKASTGGQAYFQDNDIPSILAAIFSANENIMKCNLRKAHARLEQVSTILKARTQKLEQITTAECRTLYVPVIPEIDAIIKKTQELKKKAGETTSIPLNNDLQMAQDALKERNNVITNNGCPLVY